ncbi:sigma-70 family RNA polymerase sigma factor [Actinoallomurus rhizosphaericola]|uniref:sigma-70 family RNA polymerase sigma factor n=1 Tax=Actinoallomurus rhizosphaericola TaxID=2952536 RepID=UPI002093C681|nr:sigma-70 family RNA polymerase sigma factor [Actinoallomurus rhizosphaericola]MCO5998959.1 sigma-70 family RNA polymerase sigma factor [Actinoallomurus rhizosphaericola]
MAQELRAGDATALAQIYDIYAPRLFDYCHALLRDENLAAEALRDSLIVALAHIDGLREPERFRSWLYALVRNECVRRLRDPQTPEERHPAAEEADDAFLDAEERNRRLETRKLVHSALAGLPGRHREAVDLAVRHELAAEELAGVLGISSQEALELVAESRDELDNALAAAIIARTGRGDCPSVAALVDEHEWPLPPEVSRKLVRHITSCPTCRDRRKRKVSTNRLMQVMPVAALPVELRGVVLASAAPDLSEARARVARRAEPFDAWGWPTSLDHVRPARDDDRRGVPRLWPAVCAAACVLLVAGAVFLVTGGSSAQHPSGGARRPVAAGTGASPSDSPPADDTGDSGSPDPTPSETTPTPTPTRTSRTPTPTPTATTRRPAPTPTHTRRRRSPRPVPGTLVVAAEGSGDAKTVTLTARNGVVHWTASAGPYARIDGPTGGKLPPGRSVTLGVTADKATACAQETPVEQASVSFTPSGAVALSWTC